MNALRRILRKLFNSKNLIHAFAEVSPTSDLRYCTLIVRAPVRGKKYLKVKEGSVIQGQFVFEKDTGTIVIGKNTFIGGGQFICIEGIEIGNDVLISWDCTFIDNDAHSLEWEGRKNDVMNWKKGLDEDKIGKYKNWDHLIGKKIIIEDKVWIGFKTIILKGVTVGEGAVIGAGSVVTNNVPPYTLVAGNPAREIKKIK